VSTLAAAAVAVLGTADAHGKARLTLEIAEAWRGGAITVVGTAAPPERPARPQRPELLPPNRMPKRSYGGRDGRIALLHALAHIELNAIDLAWDIVARFTDADLPKAFYDDWVGVALDEAHHFLDLDRLLASMDSGYGCLPAHDGLWQAAIKTASDLKARLAIVPMTLEARGLDTTPATIEKLRRNGDEASGDVLAVIADDEVRHVAAGVRWFRYLCTREDIAPELHYHTLIRQHFGGLKPPFNDELRGRAGMAPEFYGPLAR
jgi:uncharacterized ferritin-like protein (DUF455 family)